MDFLGNIGSGIGNIFGAGAKALGSGVGAAGGALNNIFSSFGQGAQNSYKSNGPQIQTGQNFNPMTGSKISSNSGQQNSGSFNFGNMFNNPLAKGIGGIFGSQLISNPKPPQLPQSFYNFQNQANSGGTPGMQSANQYYQGILTGNNPAAYDAATHSLDLNYQEQLRQLNGMYKSLRPGTDPLSDTTYQRDLANLSDQYARQKAQVHAQVQQGAAQGAGQLGEEQANQQMAGIETQVNQIAQQWGMDYQQRQELRNILMQMGGNIGTLGALQSLFPNAFGNES